MRVSFLCVFSLLLLFLASGWAADSTPASAGTEWQISIINIDGITKELTINPKDTINTLKHQYATLCNIHVNSITLIRNGAKLNVFEPVQKLLTEGSIVLAIPEMQIFIKNLNSKTNTLLVNPRHLIKDIKRSIAHLDNSSEDQIRLIFGGKQLEDDRTLADYNILPESTLHRVLRLAGD